MVVEFRWCVAIARSPSSHHAAHKQIVCWDGRLYGVPAPAAACKVVAEAAPGAGPRVARRAVPAAGASRGATARSPATMPAVVDVLCIVAPLGVQEFGAESKCKSEAVAAEVVEIARDPLACETVRVRCPHPTSVEPSSCALPAAATSTPSASGIASTLPAGRHREGQCRDCCHQREGARAGGQGAATLHAVEKPCSTHCIWYF